MKDIVHRGSIMCIKGFVHRLSQACHLDIVTYSCHHKKYSTVCFLYETRHLQSKSLPSREVHSLKDVVIVDMQFATSPLVRSSFGHHRGDV